MASSKPLTVLCLSPDRPLLRHLGYLLRKFGYQAVNSTDLASVASYRRFVDPAICIADGSQWENARRAIQELHQASEAPAPYTIVLWEEGSDLDPIDALDAGVDDVLSKPIRNAEVLTRLRSAARIHELNRRMACMATTHSATQLLSAHGLMARLKQLGQKERWAHHSALVILEIDLFSEQARFLGQEAARGLERALVQNTQKLEPKGLLAWLGPGRLGIVLTKTTLNETKNRAEQLRKAVVEKLQPRCTVSLGIAVLEPKDENILRLFGRASQAHFLAQNNGRNCVVASGEFDQEEQQWQECVERGNPFANNSAGDVMIPFTLWLTPEEPIDSARNKFERTQLPLLPVWSDSHGLIGLVRLEHCNGTKKGKPSGQTTVQSVMSDDFVRMEVDEDYDRVMRHFMNHRSTIIVLCRDDAPQGFVTCENLVAMVAPVDDGSFLSTENLDRCQGLLVPDNPSPDPAATLAT